MSQLAGEPAVNGAQPGNRITPKAQSHIRAPMAAILKKLLNGD